MIAPTSKTVHKVLAGNLCSGCGLCAALTGSAMIVEKPGFNRPSITKPIDIDLDRVIAEACPGSVIAPWRSAPNLHEYWGPYFELRTGHAGDSRLRHRASSGGVLSAVLIFALEQKIVDGVLQIGPDPDRPTRNLSRISRSAADIMHAAGSRYSPSSPLADLSELLNREERLAFVGKPCDVSALRLFGQSDARVAKRFPLIFSFFCAGIPSLEGSDAVVRKLGYEPDEVAAFRYRGEGWPGEAFALGKDGSERRMSYAESWGNELSKEIQFRCKICPDAVGGSADLVCADAWHADDEGYPIFTELPGRSLVIPRTKSGLDVLYRAIESGAVKIDDDALKPSDVDLMQPGQTKKKRSVRARTRALRVLLRPIPTMEHLLVDDAARRSTVTESCRNFLGTIRRVLARKI